MAVMIPEYMEWRLNKAINHYGKVTQTFKCAEECGELIRAIMRDAETAAQFAPEDESIRDNLLEEIADVYLMILQMAMIYGEDKVMCKAWEKLARLDERINQK